MSLYAIKNFVNIAEKETKNYDGSPTVQFSNTKTALARTGLHRLVPVPGASSKTSMAPSVPIDVPPNHPTSHMRALDQDDEGASSYQPDAAQIQGGRHIPWKIEGFYFLSRDRYKALYFNLLKQFGQNGM